MRTRISPLSAGVDQRFEQHIAHRFFVRFHMSLILTAVIASGVLTSRGLLELGVHSLRLRYPLAVLGSYLVFVLLVRVWIWYVKICCSRLSLPSFGGRGGTGGGSIDLSGGDSGPSGSSGGSNGFTGFRGGDSGGGGASSSWEAGVVPEPVPIASSSSSSSSRWFPDLDFGGGGDGDGWLVLLLLAALVLAIVGAGGYLVWAAPHILPEAATQALLASSLARAAKQQQHTWIDGILRSTCVPFFVVLVLAGALGWSAHHHCPTALKLVDVFRCPSL
jgi:hypothetical protein